MSQGAVIRDYRPSDLEELKRIHRQGGLDYTMPDVESPLFIVRKVMTVDDKLVCALLARVEVEAYLLLDKGDWGDPQQKFLAMKALQVEMLHDLWTQGIDNCVCWVPVQLEAYFSKRLSDLGWSRDRDGWHTWSRRTEAAQ